MGEPPSVKGKYRRKRGCRKILFPDEKTPCRLANRRGVPELAVRRKTDNRFRPGRRRLKGSGIFAAVDQEVLPGDESGLDAAKVGAVFAQLGRIAEPSGRHLGDPDGFHFL